MRSIVALTFLGLLGVGGCGELQEAKNEVLVEQLIPGTNQKAVLFVRDAGATTSESRQVTIMDAAGKLGDDPGNTFVCDNADSVSVDVAQAKVVITYSKSARVFRSESRIGAITVEYATK